MTINVKPPAVVLTGQAAAARQIELLTGSEGASVCFRTFNDDAKRKDDSLACKLVGSLDDALPKLQALQSNGAGVFVVINGGGHTDAGITRIRAVFIDGDDIPLPNAWHVAPHFLVVRDDSHWHAFWAVAEGFPLGQFTTIQRRLAQHYGSDPKIHNASRVMRLAGSTHKKNPASPVPISLHDLSAEKSASELHRYTLAEVTAGLPDAKSKATTEKKAGPSVELDTEIAIAKARAVLTEAKPAIEGDQGDATTYTLFARVLDCGVSEEMAFEIAKEDGGWNSRCSPPWNDDDLRRKIKNAKNYRQNEGVVIGRGDLMATSVFGSAASANGQSPDTGLPTINGDNSDLQFARGERGGISKTFRNALVAAMRMPAKPELDTFTGEVCFRGDIFWPEKHGRQFNDTVTRAVRVYWADKFGLEPADKDVQAAVLWLADQHTFDSLQEHIQSVQWDGVGRLDMWLTRYMSAEDTPLNRAIGRKFLIGMVCRAFEPGCKHDEMLVFEGPQGSNKSSLTKLLAGPSRFFYETSIKNLSDKDARISTRGRWIGEFSELIGISRTEVEELKAFLSTQIDDYREPYGRRNTRFPRVTLFVGTTNDSGYLMDQTGARRFWPVRTGRIDLEAFARDRDQLIAEAAFLALIEDNRLSPELWGDAASATADRLVVHPWEETLRVYVDHGPAAHNEDPKPVERVHAGTLLRNALGIPEDRQTAANAKTLRTIMEHRLGWHYRPSLRIGKLPPTSGYVRPGSKVRGDV
jgi:Virulence-associated protein E/RepB DNA-primase from phage plasmid